MRTVVVPILYNKTGDVSDRSNYRPELYSKTVQCSLHSMLVRFRVLMRLPFF